MATKKKSREAVDDATDESVPEEVVEKSGPSHFIAILQKAKTYNLAGRAFVQNVPVEVPIQHLKTFKQNGWFLVQQPR